MFDVAISFLIGFALSFALLRKVKPMFAFVIVAVVGVLFGWQLLAWFPVNATSIGYLMQGNPDMQLVWSQTHDMRQVALISKNIIGLWIVVNAFASILGYFVARFTLKKFG